MTAGGRALCRLELLAEDEIHLPGRATQSTPCEHDDNRADCRNDGRTPGHQNTNQSECFHQEQRSDALMSDVDDAYGGGDSEGAHDFSLTTEGEPVEFLLTIRMDFHPLPKVMAG
jgi:hypothetical protein